MKRAYVDSSVWIAMSEGIAPYRTLTNSHLRILQANGWHFCFSDAILLETLAKPRQYQRQDILLAYSGLFNHFHHLNIFDEVFIEALSIAESNRPIVGMDAIHVAFAVRYECELFVTTDPHFKNLNALRLHWIDLSHSALA